MWSFIIDIFKMIYKKIFVKIILNFIIKMKMHLGKLNFIYHIFNHIIQTKYYFFHEIKLIKMKNAYSFYKKYSIHE